MPRNVIAEIYDESSTIDIVEKAIGVLNRAGSDELAEIRIILDRHLTRSQLDDAWSRSAPGTAEREKLLLSEVLAETPNQQKSSRKGP